MLGVEQVRKDQVAFDFQLTNSLSQCESGPVAVIDARLCFDCGIHKSLLMSGPDRSQVRNRKARQETGSGSRPEQSDELDRGAELDLAPGNFGSQIGRKRRIAGGTDVFVQLGFGHGARDHGGHGAMGKAEGKRCLSHR